VAPGIFEQGQLSQGNVSIPVQVQFDTGAKASLVSQAYAIQHDLFHSKGPLPKVTGLGKKELFYYSAYAVSLRLTDAWNQAREHSILAYAVELEGTDLLLGMLALRRMNVLIHLATRQWRHQLDATNQSLANLVEFSKELKAEKPAEVYACIALPTVELLLRPWTSSAASLPSLPLRKAERRC